MILATLHKILHRRKFLWVYIFLKSSHSASEIKFGVLIFVTVTSCACLYTSAHSFRERKISWLRNWPWMKISTLWKFPAIWHTCIADNTHLRGFTRACVHTTEVVEADHHKEVVAIQNVEWEHKRVLCSVEKWKNTDVVRTDHHGDTN